MNPIEILLGLGSKLIDNLFPDPVQKAQAQVELLKLQQSGQLAQIAAETDLAKGQLDVNKTEAANPNLFVSGWRPFIGWICGGGLGFQFLVAPLLTWGSSLIGHTVVVPTLDLSTLLTLLLGMLGLGGMRTYEKINGVSK